jgi:hypothetical protein
MSKLKIEHGASKVRWIQLKTNVEESIANEIDLLCEWSENDRRYVINELLRFALTQDENFQKYKAEQHTEPALKNTNPKPSPSQAKPSTDIATMTANSAARTQ